MFFTYYTAGDMKKYSIIVLIGLWIYLPVSAESDWSTAYFPYDTAALSAGGTFTESTFSQRLSPALAGRHSFAASTAFFDDIHIYYIGGSWQKITFDSYYYRWGSEEWRDTDGSLLGEFYSADYSFSIGYSMDFGAVHPALQVRLHYKEIGSSRKNTIIVSPSVVYKKNPLLLGLTLLDPTENMWAGYGSWDLGYALLSLRTDYADEMLHFFGTTFFLTTQRSAECSLGLYDGQFTSGFSLSKNTLEFSYAVLFHSAGFTTHSFGITFTPMR